MTEATRARRGRRSAAAAVIAGALIIAGCTSSSGSESADTGSTGDERLSEEAFVMEFGAACASIGEELDAIPAPDSYEELATQAATAKAITADGVTELETIMPPEELQDQVDEILSMLETYSNRFDDLAAAADAEDDTRLDELVVEISSAQEMIGAELTAAGGIECGTLTQAEPASEGN